MDFSGLKKVLEDKHYQVSLFLDIENMLNYISQSLSKTTIGFGDSRTLETIGLENVLSQNNQVYNPYNSMSNAVFWETATKASKCPVFFSSVNGLAKTGEIVNMDGTGNRISGTLFGHEKVYFIVGRNKITETLQGAIERTRNIAALMNAQRLNLKTPCANKGNQCYDCNSPERICNGLVILYQKMNDVDMEIILVDVDLGF